jgi:hypothetical protein
MRNHCRVRWTKKGEEDSTFCLIKDDIFFPPFMSNETGADHHHYFVSIINITRALPLHVSIFRCSTYIAYRKNYRYSRIDCSCRNSRFLRYGFLRRSLEAAILSRFERMRGLKETVSRDFGPLVFFINQLHLGP